MRPIILTAAQLSQWLAEQGLVLEASFWERLRQDCQDHVAAEYDFLIDQVPWTGSVKVSVSFASYSKLKETGWLVNESSGDQQPDDEILVIGLIMEVFVYYPRRLQRPSRWLTPHINQPRYGMKLEHPTVNELNATWQVLTLLAPRVFSFLELMTHEFERKISQDFSHLSIVSTVTG